MNARTVGLPRSADELTGRSSNESKRNSGWGGIGFSGDGLHPTGAMGTRREHAAGRRKRGRTRASPSASVVFVTLLAHESIAPIRKEHVERRERAVALRDVLL